MTHDLPRLFTPITLRELTVPNRIWLSPMCQYSVSDRDGVPTDWHLVHLGARATGGFGLIITEAAAVVPEGRISPQDVGLWNEAQTVAWSRIVDFVHGEGASIAVQLAHAGRKGSTYRGFEGEATGSVLLDDDGWQTVAPSPVAFPGYAVPREMTIADIDAAVGAFGVAAERAERAGFDAIEIHGAHGYLIHQFLSPLSNQRTDGYGGSFENRIRFLLRIVDDVRAHWPAGKPLFVRISGTDWLPGGWDVEQSAELAAILRDRGVDLVDVSSGGVELAEIPVGPAYQVPLATEVHRAITTATVGLIIEPGQAEQILEDGHADVILLARAALREAAWPLRAAHELGVAWRDAPYPAQYTRGNWDAVPALT